jgi:hypothetical protein
MVVYTVNGVSKIDLINFLTESIAGIKDEKYFLGYI